MSDRFAPAAAPRRRRAWPRPPPLGMDRPRPDAGGGTGAGQPGARPDRPGPRALCPGRHPRRRGGRGHPAIRAPTATYNLLLLELPNGDFAVTIARFFLYAAFHPPFWRAATASRDRDLAAIAARAEKETAYHLRHAAEWLVRLGDGTASSDCRTQSALDRLWPYTGEMFEAEDEILVAADICPEPAGLRDTWNATVDTVLRRATLARPADGWMQTGGRAGRHTEHLGHMLAVMQSVARAHPGATW